MNAFIDWGYDAQRLGAIGMTLSESGGGGVVGSFSMTGQYMHSRSVGAASVRSLDPVTALDAFVFTQNYSQLADQLRIALNGVGAATYTVEFSPLTRRYKITASGAGVTSFTLSSFSQPAALMLGKLDATSAMQWDSTEDVWNFSHAENLGFSRWQFRDASPDGSEALIGADGTVRGLSPSPAGRRPESAHLPATAAG
jgi:hypothetical protein